MYVCMYVCMYMYIYMYVLDVNVLSLYLFLRRHWEMILDLLFNKFLSRFSNILCKALF